MSAIHFNAFNEVKTYFSFPENHTIEKLGQGLEALVELYSKHGCSSEEFLSLNPSLVVKRVSQAAKRAGLYEPQLAPLIRPLRGRVKRETGKALFQQLNLATTKWGFQYIDVSSHYLDIKCPKETVVSFLDGEHLKYFHANRVGKGILKEEIIASQAPIRDNQEPFWNYLFQNPSCLIDLTTPNDWNKQGYYPLNFYPVATEKSLEGKKVKICEFDQVTQDAIYEIRDEKTNEVRRIECHHFPSWPDHGAVSLKVLATLVEKAEKLSEKSNLPLMVHCLAGVGRTGTLITAIALKRLIDAKMIKRENIDLQLAALVFAFRKERGPCFVQTERQLKLLREYAILRTSLPSPL